MGWVLPGGLEGPPSRAGGGRHGEACGATKIPALPEMTDPATPQPHPPLPPHPALHGLGSAPA